VPPIPKSPLLLLLADVEVVFQNLNSGTNQHVLEGKDGFHEALVFTVGAEFHHPFHTRPIVPASIEENQLLRSGQMRHVALEVPGGAVTVRWICFWHFPDVSGQADNVGSLRVSGHRGLCARGPEMTQAV
jgi:hypothetical protein